MSIVENKKAFHDYFVEERFEAGLVLEGWEVKAIRAGRVQIKEAYVILKGAEPFVIGMHVSALPTTFIIDRRGHIKKMRLGIASRDEIEAEIKDALGA